MILLILDKRERELLLKLFSSITCKIKSKTICYYFSLVTCSTVINLNFKLSKHFVFKDDVVTWVVHSSQLQKINEEQKKKIQKTERALKVAEVC